MELPEAKIVRRLTKQLEDVYERAIANKKKLQGIYGHSFSHIDARRTAVNKLNNLFQVTGTTLVFVSDKLMNTDASPAKSEDGKTTPRAVRDYAKFYLESFLKIAFFNSVFSALESSFRVFLRAIDPKAANAGKAAFKNVYECLLKSKLSACPLQAVELLDLCSAIRNTIHNNGVYLPPNGRDKTINYKGHDYEFKYETQINYAHWDFLIDRADDLSQLLFAVIIDPNLKAINATISDPSAPPILLALAFTAHGKN